MQNQPMYALEFVPVDFPAGHALWIHDHLRHPSREIVCLHRHDCMEIGLCVEGEGVFVVEGKIMNFRTGDLSLIGPSEAHLAASSPGTTSHWIWFYLDFERLLLPHFPALDLRFLGRLHGNGFHNILEAETCAREREMLSALFAARQPEAQIAWSSLIALRLQETFQGFQPEDCAERCNGEFGRVAQAIAYFGRHYAEPVSIGAAARLCNMSVTNFRRIFKRETGASPQDYLNRIRICMAKTELRSGKFRIAEVAARCGFPSLSGFNRQFQKQLCCSPREFIRNP